MHRRCAEAKKYRLEGEHPASDVAELVVIAGPVAS
jgi:hypothetical protein